MPHNPDKFNRSAEFTLGLVSIESSKVHQASLQIAGKLAQEILKIYNDGDQNLEATLMQTGLSGQKELKLVRDYFRSASRAKRLDGRSEEGQKQLKVVADVLKLIKPKFPPKKKNPYRLGAYPDPVNGDDDY